MNNPDEMLSALIVAEVFGNLILVEPRRSDLLCSVAASVMNVSVSREAEDIMTEDCEELARMGCLAKPVPPGALGDLEIHSSLMIFDIPSHENPEEFLDLALSRVADDGFVLVDIVLESKAQMIRLQRILEVSLGEILPDFGWAEGDRLSIAGRRKAMGRELSLEVADEPLPVTVLCYVNDESVGVDELAVSLLFRQSVYPSLVLFLDDGKESEGCLPDDLWGMASQAPTQPALIRTQGAGQLAAFTEGMQHVETEHVIFIESGQSPSPRWAEQLNSALLNQPEAGFAVCAALEFDLQTQALETHCLQVPEGSCQNPYALLLMTADGLPPAGAVLYRTALLRELMEQKTLATDQLISSDLLLRALEQADMVNVPLPLLTFDRTFPKPEDRRQMMEDLHARNSLPRMVDSLEILPEEDRLGMALEIRGEAMLEVGAFDQAIEDYKAALELDPDYPNLRVEFLAALRKSGKPEQLMEQAQVWCQEEEADVRYSLLLCWALVVTDAKTEAMALLLDLEKTYPGDYRILLNLLILNQDQEEAGRCQRLIELLSGQLPDDELDVLCLP